mmetsp:Transcript_24421/g.31905  ORF Transcript_24421/g.31905 Transcript_24421/m.31905 type:complete len:599 (-) Transcript_24421:83-1879(-)|eukprot:CAMPEP_0117747790 /NCGR_PEP_ID=MMETSP0947-20121206/8705_1 /TAXON_ID=44440 /ORGANISM="Chattonella subsalsa, Strain CCMP2191" /LENGTH=598 /DNA_ID=CAMNT_0005565279 /DNA_START=143 /DNA_END=1939 /DNA_ORIENTATION=-
MDRAPASPPGTRSARKANGPNRRNTRNDAEKLKQQKRAQTSKYIEENRKRKIRAWESLNEKGFRTLSKGEARADIRALSKTEKSDSTHSPDNLLGWAAPYLNENTNDTDGGPSLIVEKKGPTIASDRSVKTKRDWVTTWMNDPGSMLISLNAFQSTVDHIREEWRVAQEERWQQEEAYHDLRTHFLRHNHHLQEKIELLDKIGDALQLACLQGSDYTSTRGFKKQFPMKEILEVLSAQLDEIRSLEQDNAYLLERLRTHQAQTAERCRAGEDMDEDVTEFDCFFDMEVSQPAWTPYGRGIIKEMRADDEVVEVQLPYGTAYLQPCDVLPAGGVRPKNLPKNADLLKAWESLSTSWDPDKMDAFEEDVLTEHLGVLGADFLNELAIERHKALQDNSMKVWHHEQDLSDEILSKWHSGYEEIAFPRVRTLPTGSSLLPIPSEVKRNIYDIRSKLDYKELFLNKVDGVQWSEAALPDCCAEEEAEGEEISRMKEELKELHEQVRLQAAQQAKQRNELEELNSEISTVVDKISHQHQQSDSNKSFSTWLSSEPSDVASDSNASDLSLSQDTDQSNKKKNKNFGRKGKGGSRPGSIRRSNSRQ